MKAIRIVLFFVTLLFLTGVQGQQREIQLELLYSGWAFSYNEAKDSIVILRNAKDEQYLSKDERLNTFLFVHRNDTVVYDEPIYVRHTLNCYGSYEAPLSPNYGLFDKWILDVDELVLSHVLYSKGTLANDYPIFTDVYKILDVKENYLKLRLDKELFEGKE